MQQLIDECAAFPNGARDDQVDALSQAVTRLHSNRTHRVQRHKGRTVMGGIRNKEF